MCKSFYFFSYTKRYHRSCAFYTYIDVILILGCVDMPIYFSCIGLTKDKYGGMQINSCDDFCDVLDRTLSVRDTWEPL